MNKIKKFLSVMFSISLLSFILPLTIQANAATPVASGNVAQRIEQLRQLFPNGSYFSVNGNACTHTSGDTCNNCRLGSIMTGRLGYASAQGNIADSWTCVAFSRYSYFFLFGNPWNTIGDPTSSTTVSAANASPGDIYVWCYNGSTTTSHAAVYLGNNQFFHANIGGTNKVSYGTGFTPLTGTSFNRVVHANNYNTINAPSSSTTKTFKIVDGPLNIRESASTASTSYGTLANGTSLTITDMITSSNYLFGKISSGTYSGRWIAVGKVSGGEYTDIYAADLTSVWKVVDGPLNIRESASTASTSYGTLTNGTTFTINDAALYSTYVFGKISSGTYSGRWVALSNVADGYCDVTAY